MFDRDDLSGCGAILGLVCALVVIAFFGPWVVMMGYNAIKEPFDLPTLGYWQFFWVTNALQVLFKNRINTNSNHR